MKRCLMVVSRRQTVTNYIPLEELLGDHNTFSLIERKTQRQTNILAQLLFECSKDNTKMPSLPQGAFAAYKVREQNNKNIQVAKMKNPEKQETTKLFNSNKKLMEYSPVKYNEKFMNAIWSHYNHYSPHNIKSNDAAVAASAGHLMAAQHQQQ